MDQRDQAAYVRPRRPEGGRHVQVHRHQVEQDGCALIDAGHLGSHADIAECAQLGFDHLELRDEREPLHD